MGKCSQKFCFSSQACYENLPDCAAKTLLEKLEDSDENSDYMRHVVYKGSLASVYAGTLLSPLINAAWEKLTNRWIAGIDTVSRLFKFIVESESDHIITPDYFDFGQVLPRYGYQPIHPEESTEVYRSYLQRPSSRFFILR